jgi:hypothetical protein
MVGTINIWRTLANKELRMEDLRQKEHMPYETQSFSQSEVNGAGDSATGDEAGEGTETSPESTDSKKTKASPSTSSELKRSWYGIKVSELENYVNNRIAQLGV